MQVNKRGGHRGQAIGELELAYLSNGQTSLATLEDDIYRETGRIVSSKLRICILLSKIMTEHHYRCAGYTDFKSYLRAERIPIKYKTAYGYARIGELIQTHEQELDFNGFTESDGIEKIRYLDVALRNYPSQRELVFSKLKTSSFRSFLSFAKGNDADEISGRPPQRETMTNKNTVRRLKIEDDTVIALLADGTKRDVVWLNPDAFDRVSQYQEFAEELMKAARSYFSEGGC